MPALKFLQTETCGGHEGQFNGVSHLMEYGLEHGMRRMVYVSSGEIYGEGDGSEFTEMSSGYVDCASVRACYPSSKRAAETLCMSYVEEYHADVVIARFKPYLWSRIYRK